MAKSTGDQGHVGAEDAVAVETFTREDVDRMIAAAARGNPAPAFEEGPHLQDPRNAAAKRDQLIAAGVDDPDVTTLTRDMLTPDMLAVLDAPEED